MKQLIRLTIIVALAAMLTACAGATRQETGTGIGAATGAGVGAILGQAIGHNTKSTLIGAGIGAVLGGVAGNQIGAYMDRQEQFVSELRDFEEKLRRVASRHVRHHNHVARPGRGFGERTVRFLAGLGLSAHLKRAPIPLRKEHVVDNQLRLCPRQIVDDEAVDDPRPRPAPRSRRGRASSR